MERRKLLKSIAAGTGIISGFANPAFAGEKSKLMDKYNSIEAATTTIEEYGNDLLNRLVSRGYLDDGSVSSLTINTILSPSQFRNGEDGLFVSAVELDGQLTGRVTARKSTGNGILELFIHPEADTNYAIIKSKNDDVPPQVIDDDDDVETEDDYDDGTGGGGDCYTEVLCTDYDVYDCYGVWTEFEWTICPSDCYKGSQTGCCGSSDSEPC